MKLSLYIKGTSCISAQSSFENEFFLFSELSKLDSVSKARIPNYKLHVPVRSLRRMGHMVRMGVCTARLALHKAAVSTPDAILVGTGMGCLHDTEEYLYSIYQSDENIASPNQFIQSTHNNVAAQIAILLNCYHFNFTYVHRGFSLESALVDAHLHAVEADQSNREVNVLVGAADELTDTYLAVVGAIDELKIKSNPALPDYHHSEGAAFFCLSNIKSDRSLAKLSGIHLIYKANQFSNLTSEYHYFMNEMNLNQEEIDVVIMGFDGSAKRDKLLSGLMQNEFLDSNVTEYKQLSGEYKTASSFAYWLAVEMINKQCVPDAIKKKYFECKAIRHILIVNNYNESNISFSLISHV